MSVFTRPRHAGLLQDLMAEGGCLRRCGHPQLLGPPASPPHQHQPQWRQAPQLHLMLLYGLIEQQPK